MGYNRAFKLVSRYARATHNAQMKSIYFSPKVFRHNQQQNKKLKSTISHLILRWQGGAQEVENESLLASWYVYTPLYIEYMPSAGTVQSDFEVTHLATFFPNN